MTLQRNAFFSHFAKASTPYGDAVRSCGRSTRDQHRTSCHPAEEKLSTTTPNPPPRHVVIKSMHVNPMIHVRRFNDHVRRQGFLCSGMEFSTRCGEVFLRSLGVIRIVKRSCLHYRSKATSPPQILLNRWGRCFILCFGEKLEALIRLRAYSLRQGARASR